MFVVFDDYEKKWRKSVDNGKSFVSVSHIELLKTLCEGFPSRIALKLIHII